MPLSHPAIQHGNGVTVVCVPAGFQVGNMSDLSSFILSVEDDFKGLDSSFLI